MPILIPFASGKGGVGKTFLASNLANLVAKAGKTVVLADCDWGGSNVHTLLGLKNNFPGIGSFLQSKDVKMSQLLLPLNQSHLFFLPGDELLPGTANMSFAKKQRLIKELKTIDSDFVFLDLGAGSSFNTVDVFLSSPLGFVLCTPEPTSILNSYGFIKTALFRLFMTAIPAKSENRQKIQDFFLGKIEQRDPDSSSDTPSAGARTISKLLEDIAAANPEDAQKLKGLLQVFLPRIIISMVKDLSELKLGARLRSICKKYLGINIEYIAFIPWDDSVRKSIIERKLLSDTDPDSTSIQAMASIVKQISENDFNDKSQSVEGYEDLIKLAEEADFWEEQEA